MMTQGNLLSQGRGTRKCLEVVCCVTDCLAVVVAAAITFSFCLTVYFSGYQSKFLPGFPIALPKSLRGLLVQDFVQAGCHPTNNVKALKD